VDEIAGENDENNQSSKYEGFYQFCIFGLEVQWVFRFRCLHD
jgi:hypothetical protein